MKGKIVGSVAKGKISGKQEITIALSEETDLIPVGNEVTIK